MLITFLHVVSLSLIAIGLAGMICGRILGNAARRELAWRRGLEADAFWAEHDRRMENMRAGRGYGPPLHFKDARYDPETGQVKFEPARASRP